MKKHIWKWTGIAVLALLAACSSGKTEDTPGGTQGLRLQMSLKGPDGEPFEGDLRVVIETAGENVPVQQWESYKDVPEVISLPAGSYRLTLESAAEMPVLSDAPFYRSRTPFEVKTGLATWLDATCGVANMKVSLELSEAVWQAYPDWEAEVFLLNDAEEVLTVLTPQACEPFFIVPAPFGVRLTDRATGDDRTVLVESYGAATHQKVVFE